MKTDSFATIIKALRNAKVRFLIAGGLAVNAHGYLRFTRDVDLVVELIPENIIAAWNALLSIGYHPIVPIRPEQFAHERTRSYFAESKQMKVLQFYSDTHPQTPVDIFVTSPFPFDEEYDKAPTKPFQGIPIRYVTLDTLIEMKRLAGQPQDLADIDQLLFEQSQEHPTSDEQQPK